MLKLKRAGRLETGGWGVGFCGLLFQGEGVCLKAGNSREVQDENGNSRGGLLDGGATFISYLAEAMRFFPFFSALSHAHCTPRLLPSRLLKKRKRERKELWVQKRTPIILCASSSRPTFPCALRFPTNKRLGTSLLHCLLVATGCPLR